MRADHMRASVPGQKFRGASVSMPLTLVMQPAKLDSSRLSIQTSAPLRSRLGKYLRDQHFFRSATVRERWSETRTDRQNCLSYLAPRRKVSGIGFPTCLGLDRQPERLVPAPYIG